MLENRPIWPSKCRASRQRPAETRRKLPMGRLRRWDAKNTAHPYTQTRMHGDMHMGVPYVPSVPCSYIYNNKLLKYNNNNKRNRGTECGTFAGRYEKQRPNLSRDTSPLVIAARAVSA